MVITSGFIVLCVIIRRHYATTLKALHNFNQILGNLPLPELKETPQKNAGGATAVLMVSGYNGVGIHSILAIQRFFPGHFKNFVFLGVGAIDSGRFKGVAEIDGLKRHVQADMERYVHLVNRLGFYAEFKTSLGTEIIEELNDLCHEVAPFWEKKVFFMGQLAFQGETFWTRLLHNQTAFALHRRLLFAGFEAVVLPIRLRL